MVVRPSARWTVRNCSDTEINLPKRGNLWFSDTMHIILPNRGLNSFLVCSVIFFVSYLIF